MAELTVMVHGEAVELEVSLLTMQRLFCLSARRGTTPRVLATEILERCFPAGQ